MYHVMELLRRCMSVVIFSGPCIAHITKYFLGEEMFAYIFLVLGR